MRIRGSVRGTWIAGLVGFVALGAAVVGASGAEIVMKDGRVLRGKLGRLDSVAESLLGSEADAEGLKRIVFLDDSLRRIFVPKDQITTADPAGGNQAVERFRLRQPVAAGGNAIKAVGAAIKIEQFDKFGRRTFSMMTAGGKVDVIQAITEITPEWTKVEGVKYMWDMRIATNSIPRDVLHAILMNQIDPKKLEDRKKLARFYLQCERYEEARAALEAILQDFPNQTDIREQLEPSIQAIRQLSAKRLLSELKLRRAAGQHKMVAELLKKFPTENVAGETLQAVREMIKDYEILEGRRAKAAKTIYALVDQVKIDGVREVLGPIAKEIGDQLDVDNLGRMAALLQNMDDPTMPAEEKLALAISGWVMGADTATPKISAALSAQRVRRLIEQYVNEPTKPKRAALLRGLPSEESAVAKQMAAILAHMKPPIAMPESIANQPGFFKLQAPGPEGQAAIDYAIQLPPEYNPYRRYPMVVTLHGAGITPSQQIDWWAGLWQVGGRMGQATRHGYIVLAPEWMTAHQKEFGSSAREHAAVLNCLRDACRRFAVDTDRVFLSGHSIGGDAAWDIGLSHPDLWAGVIPIGADSLRYCTHYYMNAKMLPFYVICGELDGNRLARNAKDLDRYFHKVFNITVVEYLGRGHENFSDEVLRIFDWMGRFRRDFFPRDFVCHSMRQWDNYFWWVEVDGFPPLGMVDPASWPPRRGFQPIKVAGAIRKNNNLSVSTSTSKVTVWLSPEVIDFSAQADHRVSITVNGRAINGSTIIKPNVEVMLEDARARGDRQHPFWAKIETAAGRATASP
jgi:predicted esterase